MFNNLRIELRSWPFAIFLCALFIKCADRNAPDDPSREKLTQEVIEVFETPVIYTPLRLDSAEICTFLLEHSRYQKDSANLVDFYGRREFQYAWFLADTLTNSAAKFLLLFGASAPDQDTLSAEYKLKLRIAQVMEDQHGAALFDDERRDLELALTAEFFHTASREYGGVVQRDLRELDWYIPRRKKNYGVLLDSLVGGEMDLSLLEPVHPQYQQLKARLKQYYALLEKTPWPLLVPGKVPYVVGDTGAMIGQLQQRLKDLGDLWKVSPNQLFDSTLVVALQRFQERHGLPASGEFDDETAAAINVPVNERIRTILLNMERLRWVPSEQPEDMLLVNIPDFKLQVYEGGDLAWDMNVVVGKSITRTVIFSGDMSRIVFAPYWTLPPGIIANETLPALKRDPSYIHRKNMELLSGGKVISASSVDWSKYKRSIPYVIRQKPGPWNALGQVKFLFPNEHYIYLHDTPSKKHFGRNKRAFSHGCIRLAEPAKLAEYILRNDTTWNAEKIATAMKGSKAKSVNLEKNIPVVISYFTAWVDHNGQLNLRDDVYGHDQELAVELFGEEQMAQMLDAGIPTRSATR